MAPATPSSSPLLKTHDVVVPIVDNSLESEWRGKNGCDISSELTDMRGKEGEGSMLAAQNSFHLSQSSATPKQGNLWREVSADYLQDLAFSTGENVKRKKRHARRRPQSFDFGVSLDPPTQLIGNFLQHQAATGTLCLDMDMRMMETLPVTTVAEDASFLQSVTEDAGLLHVAALPDSAAQNSKVKESMVHPSTDSGPPVVCHGCTGQQENKQNIRRVSHHIEPPLASKETLNLQNSSATMNRESLDGDKGENSHCSSDDEAEIQHKSTNSSFNRAQTRSRLADPPPSAIQTESSTMNPHPRSTQLKSGFVQRSGVMPKLGKVEEDEEDPFKDTDIPESLRNSKCGFLTIFQWIAFFLIMGWLVSSLTIPALVERPLWSMALWKWALLTFLLFCGRLVSGWIIRILVVILERNFLLRKKVLYFVYGLRKGVQNCLWFAFAVLAWRLVFDPKVQSTTNSKVLPFVTKVLNCLLIAAIVWLVKIFLVKVLASSFHVSTYFERIRESLFGQWVLETLAGPPTIEMEQETKLIEEINDLKKAGAKAPDTIMLKANAPTGKSGMIGLGASGLIAGGKKSGMMANGKSSMIGLKGSGLLARGKKSGMMGTGKSGFLGGLPRPTSQKSMDMKSTQNEGITVEHLLRLNQTNISAWNMKRLMNFVRYRGIYTLAHVIDQTAAATESDGQEMEIASEWQAKALAKKIFKNVAKPGSRYINRADLLRFMLEPDVDRAIPLFDGAAESGKISKNALKDFAVHVVRERRALSLSLNDTKTAVKKLHRIVDVIVGLIILVICLLVLELTTTHLLLVISSQLVLVVFIFGNTCKNVFECIVFLFVMHPFDVGDRCMVDGNKLVVEEMNILSTLFTRNTGEKIWYPNSLLSTKYIFNYGCTPDTGDTFEFCIDASTPSDKILALKDKIAKYTAGKPNLWTRDLSLIVAGIEDNNKMKMQLNVNHTINFNDDLERQIRKTELILDVKKMLQELDFGYSLLPQEVHIVNPSALKCEGNLSHLKAS